MANFNGVELPELPKWDPKTYPYAVISRDATMINQYYRLRAFKEPYTMTSEKQTAYAYSYYNVPVGDVFLMCKCPVDNTTEWSELKELELIETSETKDNGVTMVATGAPIIWSTFDIICGDTVAFAKNGELPETEDETPEPITTPVNGYKVKNGAGVKQDAYKRVGRQWVKQPQDGYEAQGGQWSPGLPPTL